MDKVQRAHNAERIMNDSAFKEALNMVEKDLIGVFRYHNATQEQIMEAHYKLGLLNSLKSNLETFMMDGEMAERREKKGMAP